MDRPDVIANGPTGRVRFADHDGQPAIDVVGGHAFLWSSRDEARTFLRSCLAVLDHAEAGE